MACEDAELTCQGLIGAFKHFGGVPGEVWVDNQKAAVRSHGLDGQMRFNPVFVVLVSHYGFARRACRPHRAQIRGKDEWMVRRVKENFFQRYRAFESLVHLNRRLELWLEEVSEARVHDGSVPIRVEQLVACSA